MTCISFRKVASKDPHTAQRQQNPTMPRGLVRYQREHHLHFVTFSCAQRKPYLSTPQARDLFERSLETIRLRSPLPSQSPQC